MLTEKEFNHLCQSLLTTGAGKVKRVREAGRREPLTVGKLLRQLGVTKKATPRHEMRQFMASLGLKDRMNQKAQPLTVDELVKALRG